MSELANVCAIIDGKLSEGSASPDDVLAAKILKAFDQSGPRAARGLLRSSEGGGDATAKSLEAWLSSESMFQVDRHSQVLKLEQMRDEHPEDDLVIFLLARASMRANRPQRAVELLDGLNEETETLPMVSTNLAAALLACGDVDRAREVLATSHDDRGTRLRFATAFLAAIRGGDRREAASIYADRSQRLKYVRLPMWFYRTILVNKWLSVLSMLLVVIAAIIPSGLVLGLGLLIILLLSAQTFDIFRTLRPLMLNYVVFGIAIVAYVDRILRLS